MAYKLDGAKFATMEELVESMYVFYQDKMSKGEFEAYARENAEENQ